MVPSSHKARQGYSATSSATDMQGQQSQPRIRCTSVTDKAPFSQLLRVGGLWLVAKTTTTLTELLYLSCLSAFWFLIDHLQQTVRPCCPKQKKAPSSMWFPPAKPARNTPLPALLPALLPAPLPALLPAPLPAPLRTCNTTNTSPASDILRWLIRLPFRNFLGWVGSSL